MNPFSFFCCGASEADNDEYTPLQPNHKQQGAKSPIKYRGGSTPSKKTLGGRSYEESPTKSISTPKTNKSVPERCDTGGSIGSIGTIDLNGSFNDDNPLDFDEKTADKAYDSEEDLAKEPDSPSHNSTLRLPAVNDYDHFGDFNTSYTP